jgi:predicted RNA methylase
MANIFLDQPEFISTDPRQHRPDGKGVGYTVTPEFMLLRHQALLPRRLIEGKTVLDLGSCTGASGAWCLSQGAAAYTGVEINEDFVRESSACLAKYYDNSRWRIDPRSIEDFLDSADEKFDVILAFGVLYGSSDPIKLLTQIANTGDCIVIESMHQHIYLPFLTDATRELMFRDPQIVHCLENAPYITVGQQGMVGEGTQTVFFVGFNPSMGALKALFDSFGFAYSDAANQALKKQFPALYTPMRRFGMIFERNNNRKTFALGFANAVDNPDNVLATINWENL